MPTTFYTWDPLTDNVMTESDENGATTVVYTNEPAPYGELISQHRDGATSYHQYDGQGSTRQLTDENGDVTDTATYTAFGEEVAKTGATTNPFGFMGALGYYANPATNDLYVRARTYQPTVGRWVSVDPLEKRLKFVWPFSSYVYANNKPLHFVDPTGLASCKAGPIIVQSSDVGFTKNSNHLLRYFSVRVRFSGCCRCCAYRQYVKGFRVRYRGINARGRTPWIYYHDPQWKVGQRRAGWNVYKEDCIRRTTWGFWPVTLCYGYRDSIFLNEGYVDPPTNQRNSAGGCCYQNFDTPGWSRFAESTDPIMPRFKARNLTLEIDFDYSFKMKVIDKCNNNRTVALRYFFIRDNIKLPPGSTKPYQPQLNTNVATVRPDGPTWPWKGWGCPASKGK